MHPEGARRRAAQPLRATTRSPTSAGTRAPGMRHAARVHRRLQQHATSPSWSTTGSPAARRPLPDGADGRRPGQPRAVLATSEDGALAATARTRSSSTSAQLESRRGHRPTTSSKVAAAEIDEFKAEYRRPLPRPRRRRDHRRGPAARGDEHRRQARAGSASTSAASSPSRC